MRGESLKAELRNHLPEAKVIIEQRRRQYSIIRPRTSLGYKPPAPETVESILATPADLASAVWRLQPDRPIIKSKLMDTENVAAPLGFPQRPSRERSIPSRTVSCMSWGFVSIS